MRPDVCRVETSGIILERVEKFDWFFFREDDIVLYDAFVLGKLEKFNLQSGYEKAILFPNRFEMYQGTKRYIDLIIEPDLS